MINWICDVIKHLFLNVFLDVLDNLTLEKTVAEFKKELEKSQESERALQSKMEELEVLPAKVDDLLRQVRILPIYRNTMMFSDGVYFFRMHIFSSKSCWQRWVKRLYKF